MLRTLHEGRLVFTPSQNATARVYEFSGQAAPGRLLSGVVLQKVVVAPREFNRVTSWLEVEFGGVVAA